MNNILVYVSYVVTVLPMLFGLAKWKSLPDKMAIHFGVDGTPNGYAPKFVAVVLIPVLMLIVQIFCTITEGKAGANTSSVVKNIVTWIVPIVSVVIAIVIYRFAFK